MSKQLKSTSMYGAGQKRRMSPLVLIGVSVTVLVALIGAAVFLVIPRIGSHAAGINMNCTIIVPDNPLTAQGLMTPYRLKATNPNDGPCNEVSAQQAAFVEAAIYDPAAGLSIYSPLVIDDGTQPGVAPTTITIPNGAIVGIWFGFQGNDLKLTGNGVKQGNCVNGSGGTDFGQFAYCNAPAFFQQVNMAIQQGKIQVPPLGTALDGQPCPTVRDFFTVDMDQSDNVVTTYLKLPNGLMAQDTTTNRAKFGNAMPDLNASDNGLLTRKISQAFGCNFWQVRNLADPNTMVGGLALNEIQAAMFQKAPIATVPAGDPMVLKNGAQNMKKLNAYRIGVDQAPVNNLNQANTTDYCRNYAAIQPARMQLNKARLKNVPSPDTAAAPDLFGFLAQRFVASFEANGLNCVKLLNVKDPITLMQDGNGVTLDATITLPNVGNAGNGGAAGGNAGGAANAAPLTCTFNANTKGNCNGFTFMVNGQNCTIMQDVANNNVNIACGAAAQQQGKQQNQQQQGQQQQGQQP